MKISLDFEFIEDGITIKPISLGMVREDGAEMYYEFEGVDWSLASEWVQNNVKPHLTGITTPLEDIKKGLLEFAGEKPEFWGYFADYDWVALCQIFGKMIDLPKGWPFYCLDLKQLMHESHVSKDQLSEQKGIEHNALDDARWIMHSVKLIKELD